ncbi:MAG: hypothetical protein WDO13_21220 [Verrucomicrobiota bacterium]
MATSGRPATGPGDADDNDYYWVPGAWVVAPEIGFLWTPCWWGWQDGAYCFHPGYWGQGVGFYGGVNYGYGYYGRGYDGGYWRGSHFHYNRAANNVGNLRGGHLYSHAVANNGSRVSFNGGRGGIAAAPTAAERRAGSERHVGATAEQNHLTRSAQADPGQRFSASRGRPALTGTGRPGTFHGTTANAGLPRGGSAETGAPAAGRASRLPGESAFTGESRAAADRVTAPRTAAANEPAGAGMTAARHVAESHVTAPRTASASHVSANHAYHASAMHAAPASHAGGFSHASFAHAPASHGGGGFAHARASVSHGGGGFHGGGGHAGGGHAGGHGGGGGHHR